MLLSCMKPGNPKGLWLLVAVLAAPSACALQASSPPTNLDIAARLGGDLEIRVGRYGIACQRLPGQSYTSYNAADVGKAGVPALTANQGALLRRIQHFEHSRTLRFVVRTNEKQRFYLLVDDFIVFDPTEGPCSAHWYWILNQRMPGNLYYAPTNAIEGPFPMMGVVTPGPWLRTASEWCKWTLSDAKRFYRNLALAEPLSPKANRPMLGSLRRGEDAAVKEACGSKSH